MQWAPLICFRSNKYIVALFNLFHSFTGTRPLNACLFSHVFLHFKCPSIDHRQYNARSFVRNVMREKLDLRQHVPARYSSVQANLVWLDITNLLEVRFKTFTSFQNVKLRNLGFGICILIKLQFKSKHLYKRRRSYFMSLQ